MSKFNNTFYYFFSMLRNLVLFIWVFYDWIKEILDQVFRFITLTFAKTFYHKMIALEKIIQIILRTYIEYIEKLFPKKKKKVGIKNKVSNICYRWHLYYI